MKKVFVLFTVVMLMAVMAWEKQSGKPVESEFLLDNVWKHWLQENLDVIYVWVVGM